MKFIPKNNQFIGRMTIKRSDSKIFRVDETKVTKYLLVDAVGEGAAAAGVKVGDVVVVTRLMHVVQDAGMVFIPFAEEKDIALFVTDVGPNELLVQTPSGKEFVAFDSENAAKSWAAQKASNGQFSHTDDATTGASV